jgi:integrase
MQKITASLREYSAQLVTEELSERTRIKYVEDIMRYISYCGDANPMKKSSVIQYKQQLLRQYKVSTVNSYLISVNRFLGWLNRADCTVKTIRAQRKTGLENVLTFEEYTKLLAHCLKKQREKSYLLLRTLAGTGIRIGELAAITREAAEQKTATVIHKGKSRRIFLSGELSRLLLGYCKNRDITSGIIFRGKRENTALHPSGVWKSLKRIAAAAGVEADKVYPHSLRHLFAKIYMEKVGNIFELADLLGHSSVETTRIYALTTNAEKSRRVEELCL